MRHFFSGRLAAIAALASVGAGSALADLSNSVFHVTATTATGSGDFDVNIGQGSWNGTTYSWQLGGAVTINDQNTGQPIVTMNSASVTYVGDPIINLFFNFQNAGAPTLLTVSSGLLSFAPISPAQSTASAGITVTDVSLDGNAVADGVAGATGNRCFQANLNGLIPGGTQFAELVNDVSVNVPNGSNTGSGNTGGLQNVAGAVSSMSSQFKLIITPDDSVSGTSNFRVVPEPASLALLLAGGIFLTGRRR